jgi:glucose/mannose-6-phosphate isomerase
LGFVDLLLYTFQLGSMERLLDDQEYLESHDRDGMLSALTRFPLSAKMAIRDAEKLELNGITKKINNLVAVGMGGSAVGGILLRDWLRNISKTPIFVSLGNSLPAWVDENTLVYAVSYSGNTEETLSQYHQALEIGCPLICFSSGGELSNNASLRKIPLVRFPKGYMPRGAIAFQFFGIAAVTRNLGLIGDDAWMEVDEAIGITESLSMEMGPEILTDSNFGKALAEKIKDYIPYVYGSSLYEGVAYRYSTQLNENSKSPASALFFPEAFHNSISAREAPPELLEQVCALIIRDRLEEGTMAAKIDRFIELIAERFGKVVEIEARGEGRLARMISAMCIGDFASVYLGMLYGHDPSSNDSIDALKEL